MLNTTYLILLKRVILAMRKKNSAQKLGLKKLGLNYSDKIIIFNPSVPTDLWTFWEYFPDFLFGTCTWTCTRTCTCMYIHIRGVRAVPACNVHVHMYMYTQHKNDWRVPVKWKRHWTPTQGTSTLAHDQRCPRSQKCPRCVSLYSSFDFISITMSITCSRHTYGNRVEFGNKD